MQSASPIPIRGLTRPVLHTRAPARRLVKPVNPPSLLEAASELPYSVTTVSGRKAHGRARHAPAVRIFESKRWMEPHSAGAALEHIDPASLVKLADDIRAAKASADFVVVAFHKGIVHTRARLAPYERPLAHAAR